MQDDRENLLTLVARLYYLDNLGQSEISDLVGVSRSQVSRILTAARQRGIVQISVAPYEPRHEALESRLIECFGLSRAIVIKLVDGASTAQVRRTLGYFAGPLISEWLQPNSVVGLAGGRTLAELIRYVKTPATQRQGMTVVQLMGNVGPNVSEYDAAELCHLLVRRTSGVLYALSTPAFAPDARTRDIFLAHTDLRYVWQLFNAMQTAMVGIGTLEDSIFIQRGLLSRDDLHRLRTAGAVGEICGRFYDRDGRECPTEYRDRVIGIELDHLRDAVPQVIGVTNGAARAAALVPALRSGLLKSLVIDEVGAAAVLAAA